MKINFVYFADIQKRVAESCRINDNTIYEIYIDEYREFRSEVRKFCENNIDGWDYSHWFEDFKLSDDGNFVILTISFLNWIQKENGKYSWKSQIEHQDVQFPISTFQ